jgi:hypothetical protein
MNHCSENLDNAGAHTVLPYILLYIRISKDWVHNFIYKNISRF